jgi:hypothetical protein
MWTCKACGTQGIAGDLVVCPGCGRAVSDTVAEVIASVQEQPESPVEVAASKRPARAVAAAPDGAVSTQDSTGTAAPSAASADGKTV